MATSYQEIYFKSAGIIDSYKLDKLIQENLIGFFKPMYPFLLNAIGEIVSPIELYEYLKYRKEPIGETQIVTSDGVESNYVLDFVVDPSEYNVFFDVYLDEVKLNYGVEYVYDKENNSINLTTLATKDSVIIIDYYYTGEIIGTNNDNLIVTLSDQSTQILAATTTLKWLEKNKNRELNIRANLGVKEYNMFSPANLIKETKALYKTAYDIMVNTQKSLTWDKEYMKLQLGKGHNLFATVKSK